MSGVYSSQAIRTSRRAAERNTTDAFVDVLESARLQESLRRLQPSFECIDWIEEEIDCDARESACLRNMHVRGAAI